LMIATVFCTVKRRNAIARLLSFVLSFTFVGLGQKSWRPHHLKLAFATGKWVRLRQSLAAGLTAPSPIASL